MRLIDADALKSDIAKLKESPWFNTKAGYAYRKEAIVTVEILCVDKAPTVDSVKHGRWLDGTCSECGKHAVNRVMFRGEVVWEDSYDYCPHCGARMQGRKGEAEKWQ